MVAVLMQNSMHYQVLHLCHCALKLVSELNCGNASVLLWFFRFLDLCVELCCLPYPLHILFEGVLVGNNFNYIAANIVISYSGIIPA